MAFEAEWSMDFCLSCDKQSTEGPYCSQACRLADLERAGSPRTACSSSPSSAASSWSHGFYLPPAIDFHSYNSKSAPEQTHHHHHHHHHQESSKRDSVSSLDTSVYAPSSDSRHGSSSCLTEGARLQLQQYENAFDNTRHKKHQPLFR